MENPAGKKNTVVRWGVRVAVVAIVAALVLMITQTQPAERQIRVAAAKGALINASSAAPSARTLHLLDVAEIDPSVSMLLGGKRTDFLYANDLGVAESAEWRNAGCASANCTHLTYYNYDDGGTIEVVVNSENNRVVDSWSDENTRPLPSATILNDVLDIANSDKRVTDVLGDIRRARDLMVPMSTWLQDDACNEDWCVDLTFHDPTGSGRVFHVVVNMQLGEVARTFYSRGRAQRDFSEPLELNPNVPPWNDGCHEQGGWEVCWEMTAHDGLNFYDVKYAGQEIFSSAKIGQVEAFYPSWPGGYRDEIGSNSTVPPKYGTQVSEFDGGFAVRQLFTEPFDWPNCICCYRYEQIIHFYDDGTWEPRFISHGPGCDAEAEYRPFWRIDLDLDGADDDTVWAWEGMGWVSAEKELDLELFGNLSLEGEKLATYDGSVNYRWIPEPTDPLGNDLGRLFVVRYNEDEGDGPILTGAADTFQPPSGLVDGESASGRNVVVWYVPVLRSIKSEPFWCMPDPEPDFSPCEAILTIAPGGELRQPTDEEIQQLYALTPTPEVSDSAETPTSIAEIPPTPRPITGESADEIVLNSGCGACHLIGEHGDAGKVGPDLSNIGNLAANRVPGQPAEEYLRNSILYPDLFIAPACPNGDCLAHVMPGDYYLRLTDTQIDQLVDYLLQQTNPAQIGSETTGSTVIGDDGVEVLDSAENSGQQTNDLQQTGGLLIIGGIIAVAIILMLLFLRSYGRGDQADAQ